MNNSQVGQLLWQLIAPLLLAMPRVLAAVSVSALFPAALFPVILRNVVAISLALGIYPHILEHTPDGLGAIGWLLLIAKEIFIGALIGIAVASLVWVLESVGGIIDTQVGYANASLFDPFGGHQAGPLSGLMSRLAVVLFVVGGGLQVLVSLLYESFQLWPVASYYPVLGQWTADFAIDTMGSIAQLFVRLVAPVLLLLVMIDLGFGLVGRVAPQLNVFYFTMPIKGTVAALMFALYMAHIADIVADHVQDMAQWLARLTGALVAQ